ncbi:hypothetical protein ABGB07_03865 [Micromonosporaceae bacterium B7E4]
MPRERIATWPNGRANRLSARLTETLAGARVITYDEIERYQVFAFDPGGSARNVDLPPEEVSEGAYLFISNMADAAEIITIRNDAGTTIGTPAQAECSIVWCDGVNWYGITGVKS